MKLGGHLGVTLSYLLGSAAAYICLRRNKLRKAAAIPAGRSRNCRAALRRNYFLVLPERKASHLFRIPDEEPKRVI